MFKSLLAVVCGLVVRGIVLPGVELVGHIVFPLPEDLDRTDTEALAECVANAPLGGKLAGAGSKS